MYRCVVDNNKEPSNKKPTLDFSLVMTEKTLADQEAERQALIGADPSGGENPAAETQVI